MAEGVFRNVAASRPSLIAEIDSSGTGAYHAGDTPDSRTMSTLRRHGITDYNHFAQKITKEHFLAHDYLIAMDHWNLSELLEQRESVLASCKSGNVPPAASSRGTKGAKGTTTTTRAASAAAFAGAAEGRTKVAEVRLFGDFQPGGKVHNRIGGGEVVHDPYYGGSNGFEEVYQQVTRFSKNFLDYLEKTTT